MRVSVILIELLPRYKTKLSGKVLPELDLQILLLLRVLLVRDHQLQFWIDRTVISHCVNQSDDVLFVVGQLGTYDRVYAFDGLEIDWVVPLQSMDLEAVGRGGEMQISLLVCLQDGEEFRQVCEDDCLWAESSSSDAHYTRPRPQLQHSFPLEQSLSHLRVLSPIVDHSQGTIPHSPRMTQRQILAYDDILPVDLDHAVDHVNNQMQREVVCLKLLFTRHGETEDNIKGTICGQQPGSLTKNGKEQAKKIGVFLKNHPLHFDHIYVSDLGRTVATFENIKSQAKYLQKIPTTLTKLIREKSGGIFQGRPLATWKQMADKQHKGVRDYKCEKGQSWADVNGRCFQFLKFIVDQHIIRNKNLSKEHTPFIFAVAHGGVLMEFHNLVGMIMEKREPVFKNTAKNCSFHEFLIEYPLDSKEYKLADVRIKCTKENAVEHLTPA